MSSLAERLAAIKAKKGLVPSSGTEGANPAAANPPPAADAALSNNQVAAPPPPPTPPVAPVVAQLLPGFGKGPSQSGTKSMSPVAGPIPVSRDAPLGPGSSAVLPPSVTSSTTGADASASTATVVPPLTPATAVAAMPVEGQPQASTQGGSSDPVRSRPASQLPEPIPKSNQPPTITIGGIVIRQAAPKPTPAAPTVTVGVAPVVKPKTQVQYRRGPPHRITSTNFFDEVTKYFTSPDVAAFSAVKSSAADDAKDRKRGRDDHEDRRHDDSREDRRREDDRRRHDGRDRERDRDRERARDRRGKEWDERRDRDRDGRHRDSERDRARDRGGRDRDADRKEKERGGERDTRKRGRSPTPPPLAMTAGNELPSPTQPQAGDLNPPLLATTTIERPLTLPMPTFLLSSAGGYLDGSGAPRQASGAQHRSERYLPVADPTQPNGLSKPISQGVYGVVREGIDSVDGKRRALKQIFGKHLERNDVGFPFYLLKEFDIVMRAHHPNIVQGLDIMMFSKKDGSQMVFLVMELCKKDLKSLIYSRYLHVPSNKLSDTNLVARAISRTKCVMVQMLKGLAFLHEHNILHRDMKCSNVLIDEKGVVKLCDFGLACFFRDGQALDTNVVTLIYRGPELHFGIRDYTTALDMWSAGCIFFECLRTKPLFVCTDEPSHFAAICNTLGEPTESDFPGFQQLPKAVECLQRLPVSMEKRCNRIRSDPELFGGKYASLISDCGYNFLMGFLKWNPKDRLTATEALKHPYLTEEEPLPCAPEELNLPLEIVAREAAVKSPDDNTADTKQSQVATEAANGEAVATKENAAELPGELVKPDEEESPIFKPNKTPTREDHRLDDLGDQQLVRNEGASGAEENGDDQLLSLDVAALQQQDGGAETSKAPGADAEGASSSDDEESDGDGEEGEDDEESDEEGDAASDEDTGSQPPSVAPSGNPAQ